MKKGMTPGLLVGLVILGVITFIFAYNVIPAIFKIMTGSAGTVSCNLALVAKGAYTEYEACKMQSEIFMPANLDVERAKKEVPAELEKHFADLSMFQYSGGVEAWAFDRLLADEFYDCYERTAAGLSGKVLPTNDVLCVICSRVIVPPETVRLFGGTTFDPKGYPGFPIRSGTELGGHFVNWMLKSDVAKKEFGDEDFRSFLAFERARAGENKNPPGNVVLGNPMAVVLIHIPAGLRAGFQSVSWIDVYNYEELSKMNFFGGYKCDAIIG